MMRRVRANPATLLAVPTLLILLIVLGGCDSDPVAPPPGPPPSPDPGPPEEPSYTLPVLGHGPVTDRYTSEVAVRGGWAYTGTWGNRDGALGNTLHVWDVSSDEPVLARTIELNQAVILGDVQISDDGSLLVVATEFSPGSIAVYSLADPGNPVQLSRFVSSSTTPGVHTVKLSRIDGRLYAFLSVNPDPPRLVVVDLTDPENPVQVLSRTMGTPYLHDVHVRDGILFTALWNGGVSIWDVGGAHGGSPSDPVFLGNVRTQGGNAHNAWWFHDPQSGQARYLFVGQEFPLVIGHSSAGVVHVVDVSDLTQPVEVAYFHVPGAGAHNFWMDEESGVLYAAFYNGGVRAIDARGDLGSCAAGDRDAHGRCDLRALGHELGVGLVDQPDVFVWGVQYQDGRVYASDQMNGLFVLDASALRR